MPVLTQYAPDTYQGDGVATAFPITFDYQLQTDIIVSTIVVATGVVTPLTYGTDYTVTPLTNSPAGTGTVTLLTGALPTGTDITLARAVPLTQDTTWVPNDPNPSTATENAVDKLTMIVQDIEYQVSQIPSGGGGGSAIVTTAVFAIAAVGVSQTVAVNATTGFAVGNSVQISNAAFTMFGQITALAPLSITLTTSAITVGTAGTNMPVGAAVQIGSPPGTNQVTVQDVVFSQTPSTGFVFEGSSGAATATTIRLFVADVTAGLATIGGYVAGGISYNQLSGVVSGSGPTVFYNAKGSAAFFGATAAAAYQVAQVDSAGNIVTWALLGTNNIGPQTITPAQLLSTNSPADTQVPTYDLATGKFTWTNGGGGGGLPGNTDTSQFLRGDATYSNVINMIAGLGGHIFAGAETTNTVGAFLGLIGSIIAPPTGFDSYLDFAPVKKGVSTWVAGGKVVWNFAGPLAVTMSGTNAVYNSIDASNVEIGQFCQFGAPMVGVGTPFTTNIFRADSFRAGAGYWQYAYTVNAPASSLTVDIKNGTYQRHTSIANNVSITLADSTPAPTTSGFQYANELTLEINSPGVHTYTWPGTVTWANGGSAPTLNSAGINVVRLVRRQGQTQWIGFVEGGTFSLTAGIINSSSYFAAGVIPLTALTSSGTPDATKFLRGDYTWAVPSGAILATNLGSTITGGPFTTINFVSNITGSNGGGGVLNVSAAGGGGSFNPGTSYTWTAAQSFTVGCSFGGVNTFNGSNNFNAANTFGNTSINATNTFNFAGVGAGTFGIVTIGQTDSSTYWHGIDININDVGIGDSGGGLGNIPITIQHISTNPSKSGANTGIFSTMVNATPTAFGHFNVNIVAFTNCTKIGTGSAGGTSDATFFTTQTPNNFYTGTNDPFYPGVGHHSFGGGTFRVGEINYGNTWGEFNLQEYGGISYFVAGWECYPQVAIEYPTFYQYDAQWALHIGNSGIVAPAAGPGQGTARNACNYIGLLVDKDAISPGGYALRLWGSVSGSFNGGNAAANAPASMIKMSGTMHNGIDFTGYNTGITGADSTPATIIAELVTGHSNLPAIQLAQGMAICLKMPTGPNTGTYIVDNGSNLRATRDGGNTWTNLI